MARFSRYLCEKRLRKVIPFIRGSILDLGCGPATVLELMPKAPQIYVGVESSQSYLSFLREKYPQYTFLHKDLDSDGLELNQRFDTILMTAVIEHIFNQKHFFEQALAHLAEGGRIIITTPTPFGDRIHRLGSLFGFFAAAAVERHIVIYSRPRFDVLCGVMNLKMEKYERFEFLCNQLAVLSVRQHEQKAEKGAGND